MGKLVAFSYSRLTSYETCPKKYHALSVAKSVKEEPNEHTEYGTEMHLAFANYFKKGTALPMQFSQYEKYLKPIKAAVGQFIVEQKLTINADYEGTGWFDKDAYCRVISDLTIVNGSHALTIDWKSGKPSDDFTQLRLVAAVIFLLAPQIQTITMAYFWTKNRTMTRETIKREEMPEVFNALAPRLQRYQDAHAAEDFPARPSYLCRYCPVTACPYWEKR